VIFFDTNYDGLLWLSKSGGYHANMKHLTVAVLLLASMDIVGQSYPLVDSAKFEKLRWLAGIWERTNISPGRSSYERWEIVHENALGGLGVTIQGNDTVFIEKISIIVKDNSIYYVADVPENQHPVFFKFVEITENGFTCENPQHDFPKKISYELDGTTLKARISGDNKIIDYYFKRR